MGSQGKIASENRFGFQAPIADSRLKCCILEGDTKSNITGSNMHKMDLEKVWIQDELSPCKLIEMTNTWLFLPVINIAIIRNTLEEADFPKPISRFQPESVVLGFSFSQCLCASSTI